MNQNNELMRHKLFCLSVLFLWIRTLNWWSINYSGHQFCFFLAKMSSSMHTHVEWPRDWVGGRSTDIAFLPLNPTFRAIKGDIVNQTAWRGLMPLRLPPTSVPGFFVRRPWLSQTFSPQASRTHTHALIQYRQSLRHSCRIHTRLCYSYYCTSLFLDSFFDFLDFYIELIRAFELMNTCLQISNTEHSSQYFV